MHLSLSRDLISRDIYETEDEHVCPLINITNLAHVEILNTFRVTEDVENSDKVCEDVFTTGSKQETIIGDFLTCHSYINSVYTHQNNDFTVECFRRRLKHCEIDLLIRMRFGVVSLISFWDKTHLLNNNRGIHCTGTLICDQLITSSVF